MPEPAEPRPEPDLELVRVSVREDGAFGVLQALQVPAGQPGIPFALTCEHTYPLPDTARGQFLKIPAGLHRCSRSYFHRGRHETFEIHVDGHERILFHKGNTEDDVDGCVLVGRRFGLLHGRPAILESLEGFREFMAWAGRRSAFELLVRHADGAESPRLADPRRDA